MSSRKHVRYWLVLVGLLVVATIVTYRSESPPALHTKLRAVTATGNYDFLNSLGVNVHTSLPQYASASRNLAALRDIGFWHVRDSFSLTSAQSEADQSFLSAHGIRFDLLTGAPPPLWGNNIAAELAYADGPTFAGGAHIDAVEGSNEVDNHAVTDPNWAVDARRYQQELYDAVKADPILGPAGRNVPVLGPSVRYDNVASSARQLGNLADYADFGSLHTYPNMMMPATAGYPEYGASSNTQSLLARLRLLRENVYPGKAFWITEVGYRTPWDENPETIAATEKVSSYYYPRLFLEYYRLGIRRIFAYELFDEANLRPPQSQWGLIRSDGVTLKPDGAAVKNLFTILHDTVPSTGVLSYCTCGAPADVHELLLHRSDGTFFLALWRAIYIPASGADLASAGGSENVTVSFDKPYRLEVFHPSNSATAQPLPAGSRVVLPVSGSVSLLEIAPTASSGPSATGKDAQSRLSVTR